MVNAEMFRNTIPPRPQQPAPQPQYHYPQPVQYVQQPAPVAPAPHYPQPAYPQQPPIPPQQEDPEVKKFRVRMLKILSWAVGGAAIILLVWRIILKFI